MPSGFMPAENIAAFAAMAQGKGYHTILHEIIDEQDNP